MILSPIINTHENGGLVLENRHAEYSYKAQKSDTVIVFIHGIQGSPLQFDFMIESLNGLYSIENLLLPGHGKKVKDFKNSGMDEWQKYLDAKVKLLQKEYKNIILVGHSMGALLAVCEAYTNPESIRGLFLTAMPLRIRMRFSYIKNNLAVAFSKKDRNEIIAAARKGNSTETSNPFSYLLGMPRYIELMGKIKSTRELIERLNLPTVVVHSENDEIVSKKALEYLKGKKNIRIVVVKNAGHYYVPEEARKQISGILNQFIREITF